MKVLFLLLDIEQIDFDFIQEHINEAANALFLDFNERLPFEHSFDACPKGEFMWSVDGDLFLFCAELPCAPQIGWELAHDSALDELYVDGVLMRHGCPLVAYLRFDEGDR